MRGNVLSLYYFKIKSAGFSLEDLKGDFAKKKLTEVEYNHLVEFYDRCMLG